MPTTNNELAQILKFLDAQRPTAPSDATRVGQEELIPQLRIPGQDVVKLAEPRREASLSTGYSDREIEMGYTDEAISDIAMGMITPGGAAKKSVKNVLAKWKGKRLGEAFDQRKKEWTEEFLGGRYDDSGKFTKAKTSAKHKPHYIPEIIDNKKVYTVDHKLGNKRYDYIPKVDLNPNAAKQSFSGQQQSFVDGQYLIEESVKVGAMKGNK